MNITAALILSLKHILSISEVKIKRKYETQRKLNEELNKEIPYNNVVDNINDELCAITVSISGTRASNA
jgi:hypothetical protein